MVDDLKLSQSLCKRCRGATPRPAACSAASRRILRNSPVSFDVVLPNGTLQHFAPMLRASMSR